MDFQYDRTKPQYKGGASAVKMNQSSSHNHAKNRSSKQTSPSMMRKETILNLQPLFIQEEMGRKDDRNIKDDVPRSPFDRLSSYPRQQQTTSYDLGSTTNKLHQSGSGNNNDNESGIPISDDSSQSTAASDIEEKGQLISNPHDRANLGTYCLTVLDQLRLVENIKFSKNTDDDDSYICGFQCKHCLWNGRKKFIRFPETMEEVENELLAFRYHLDSECTGIKRELHEYLRWMENGYHRHCHIKDKGYIRFIGQLKLQQVTKLVCTRLDAEEIRGNAQLQEANRKYAIEVMKKRKKTHSVLESLSA